MHNMQKMILQNTINANKLHTKKASQQQHIIFQGGHKVLPQVIEKLATQYVTI